ncbi:MAG: hypothetical protein J0L55_06560 [Caulobacterales bacterium]|nr:hypothetical protein [Caulobacterales bacterium]MCA0372905.1 hypothetical protein [Pseudomonadota bacterium]
MNINRPIIRHLGALGFLSMLGLTVAMIPIALYAIVSGRVPQNDLVYLIAAIFAGAIIGWVTKR